MNFKLIVITSLMFFVVLPQSITTTKTINPIVEIPFVDEKYKTAFIGFEGNGIYKKAQLYAITQKNTLKPLPNFQFILPEEDTNYFVDAVIGDITGEGMSDFILILTNPNSGTKVYTWTIDNNNLFSRLTKPHLIKNNQTESYPTTIKLSTIYPDKDQEIVISFGSPDRKIVILDYLGKIKETETIGKEFLSNLAGPIIMETADFNNDNLDEIYILNNGEKAMEATYFSPNREETIKEQFFEQPVKDVYIYQKKGPEKAFLLSNNQVLLESWSSPKDLEIKDAKKILLINKKVISIISKKGAIYNYKIDDKKEDLVFINKVNPLFKNKQFSQLNHLVLRDQENVLISHNNNSEIILQPLYYNMEVPPEEKAPNEEQEENKTVKEDLPEKEQQKKEDDILLTKISLQKKLKEEEKGVILNTDTLYINLGQEANILIDLNPQYNFIDLKTETKPNKMEFNISSLAFNWFPGEEEIGYHDLQYNITYTTNTGIKKEIREGKLLIKNETKSIQEQKKYIIFVNASPKIQLKNKTYKIQAEHKINIEVSISDLNSKQRLKTSYKFKPKADQNFSNNLFSWTPTNKNFGNNAITFFVTDGHSTDSIKATIVVDTLKQKVSIDKKLIATLNKEFTYNLPPAEKYYILKGPSNLRISNKGTAHWIPINTQTGKNPVEIEIKGQQESYTYALEIFVNAPPIISYRPEKIEYINHKDKFQFQLQNFDLNTNQSLFWNLGTGPEGMSLKNSDINWKADKLDIHKYSIELSDSIDVNRFNGILYVNDKPQVLSIPPQHTSVSDVFEYTIQVEDKNLFNPITLKKEEHVQYKLIKHPKKMLLNPPTIKWKPSIEDIGLHSISVEISDGLETINHNFSLLVNDTPIIIGSDSLRVQVGDTLRHILQAEDKNTNSVLTYSIRSELKDLMLNAQTGEIIWIPTKEDLGLQEITVNVTDGFSSNSEGKKIQILVYSLPKIITELPTEGFVNIEYEERIEAQDGFGKIEPNKDFFIALDSTTFSTISFEKEKSLLTLIPTIDEIGIQKIAFSLKDNYNNIINKEYSINVIISPCETEDTTVTDYIPIDQESNKGIQSEANKQHQKGWHPFNEDWRNSKDKFLWKQWEPFNKEQKEEKPAVEMAPKEAESPIIKEIIPEVIEQVEEVAPFIEKVEKVEEVEEVEEVKERTTEEPLPIAAPSESMVLESNQQTIPPPNGQKVNFQPDFEKQKWGQEAMPATQKTKSNSTIQNYKKGWK